MPGNGKDRLPTVPQQKPVLCRLIITHYADDSINLSIEPQVAPATEVYGLLEIAREIILKGRIAPAQEQPRIVGVRTLPPGLG